ncbi:hypothetical protein GCM10023314_30460 [Algibacter agarivorans]|uniref:Uncharacterized protein n=2 Tax=Algibacter agarivorans TaxID=1109741 RepID=A0ABP9GVR0_9FLAO
MLKYCLIKNFRIMKQVSEKPNMSLQEAEEHYRVSSENYDVDSGENHLAYYRDKHPKVYQVLLNSV